MIDCREKPHTALLAVVTTCIYMLTGSCKAPRSTRAFDFEGGRLVMRNSPGEVAETRAALKKISTTNVPRSAAGSVVFDGEVVSRHVNDKFGQPAWQMNADYVYIGMSELSSKDFTVASPTIENGGVVLKMGKKYRILAVNFDGQLYTWRAAVLELPDSR